jgi:hypothetical protein
MHRARTRWGPAKRLCRGTASLALAQPTHLGRILRDPCLHLFAGERPRFGEPSARFAEPQGKKQQQLLLLLWWQSIGRGFNSGQRAYAMRTAQYDSYDKNCKLRSASRE